MRRIIFPVVLALALAFGCSVTVEPKAESPATRPTVTITAPATTRPTTTTRPAPTTTRPTTTTTAPLREQFAAWYEDNSDIIDGIIDAQDDVATAAGNYDSTALADACDTLVEITTEGMTRDPLPDPDINDDWQSALADFRAGGLFCAAGALTYDADLLEQGVDKFESATAYLETVNDAMDDL